MNAKRAIQAIVRRYDISGLAFLVGSGVSVASGLPTGWAFNTEMALFLSSTRSERARLHRALTTGLSGSSKGVRFEQVVQILRDMVDPGLRIIEFVELAKQPGPLHTFLAGAIHQRARVFTTNFDFLIESAYRSLYSQRPLAQVAHATPRRSGARSFREYRRRRGQFPPSLFKLHGTLTELCWSRLRTPVVLHSSRSINATLDTIGTSGSSWGLEPDKEAVLLSALTGRPLVVVGYSGLDDFDVNPSLRRALMLCPALIWIYHQSGRPRYLAVRSGKVPPGFPLGLGDVAGSTTQTYFVTGDTQAVLGSIFGLRLPRVAAPAPAKSLRNFLHSTPPYEGMDLDAKDNCAARILELAGDLRAAARRYHGVLSRNRRCSSVQDRRARAWALSGLGRIARTQGELAESLTYFQRAQDLASRMDPGEAARLRSNIASVHLARGRISTALRVYSGALALYRRVRDPVGTALVLGNMGICHGKRGDYRRAIPLLRQALLLNRRHRNREGIARDLGNLGTCYLELGRYAQAIKMLQGAMRLNEELRRLDGRAIQLCNLGIAFRHQRRRREALDVLQEALLLNRRLRRREGIAECLSAIAGVYYDSGQPGDALRYLARALKIERAIDDREGLAGDLELRGRIHEDRGAMRRAVEMYRESRNHYRYFGHFKKAAEMARRIGCLSRS